MLGSLKNKRSLTDRISSNRVENNAQVIKKRKHLTVKSDTNEITSNSDWKPPNWEETLDNIRKMRKDIVAPVDNMGCDQAADLNEPPEVCTHNVYKIKFFTYLIELKQLIKTKCQWLVMIAIILLSSLISNNLVIPLDFFFK